MQLARNIGNWILSLLAASFVAGFFVSIGFILIGLLTELMDDASLQQWLNIFGFVWALSILPIAANALLPALIISIFVETRSQIFNKKIYGVAGAATGIFVVLFGWLWGNPIQIFQPDQWLWEFLTQGIILMVSVAFAGAAAGYEFANLRQGRLRWQI